MTDLQILSNEDIAYVKELAQEAGRKAVDMRSGVSVKQKSGPNDVVTAADLALSDLIIKSLRERFPDDTIVSEEDEIHKFCQPLSRVWLVDPIDGTDNYLANDGQWSVMIGLLCNLKPVFGWVFAPATDTHYFGGPEYGAWKSDAGKPTRYQTLEPLPQDAQVRIMMGFRDRKAYPWVMEHPKITLVKAGSIGLKVAKILADEADIFVHLSGKLKTWDTAAPSAIALGASLDVGALEKDELPFPLPEVCHNTSVIIGRPGSLIWARTHLRQRASDLPLQI